MTLSAVRFVAAVLACLVAVPAMAVPLQWSVTGSLEEVSDDLNGNLFPLGLFQEVTGHFVFEADTGDVSDIQIGVASQSFAQLLDGTTYFSFGGNGYMTLTDAPINFSRLLDVVIDSPLGNAGGIIGATMRVIVQTEQDCSQVPFGDQCDPFIFSTTALGSVVLTSASLGATVPLPGGMGLLAGGLVGLGLLRRRKR